MRVLPGEVGAGGGGAGKPGSECGAAQRRSRCHGWLALLDGLWKHPVLVRSVPDSRNYATVPVVFLGFKITTTEKVVIRLDWS